ncbi:hypothetical protein [Endothiovibrio diazotrophicus]
MAALDTIRSEPGRDGLSDKNGDITSHYSAAELEELIEASNRVCRAKSGKNPALVMLKRKTGQRKSLTR